MDKGLKEKILELYNSNMSYNNIAKTLKCSKGIISYHCRKYLNKESNFTSEKVKKYQDYYDLGYTMKETALYFGFSPQTITKYLKLRQLTSLQKEQRNLENKKSYRNKVKYKAVEYKGGSCIKCGYNKCMSALDFHHVNPVEKDFSISGGTKSFESIKKELDKCILVCRNCHSEIHAGMHPDISPHTDNVLKE